MINVYVPNCCYLLGLFSRLYSLPGFDKEVVLGASTDQYTSYSRILTPAPTATTTPTPTPTPMPTPTPSSLSYSILQALNIYRQSQGMRTIAWSESLAYFAQGRADKFNQDHHLDNHDGFHAFVSNPNNIKGFGFSYVAENSAYNVSLEPKKLIEESFATHELHNTIQLDPRWTHAGVGMKGRGVDIVFGRR